MSHRIVTLPKRMSLIDKMFKIGNSKRHVWLERFKCIKSIINKNWFKRFASQHNRVKRIGRKFLTLLHMAKNSPIYLSHPIPANTRKLITNPNSPLLCYTLKNPLKRNLLTSLHYSRARKNCPNLSKTDSKPCDNFTHIFLSFFLIIFIIFSQISFKSSIKSYSKEKELII